MQRRILVTGSRTWSKAVLLADVLGDCVDRLRAAGDEPLFVHGACYPKDLTRWVSADYLTHLFCKTFELAEEKHPAQWVDGNGNIDYAAGPARNRLMASLGAYYVFAFRAPGVSRGTDGMIEICQRAWIPGEVVWYDGRRMPWDEGRCA